MKVRSISIINTNKPIKNYLHCKSTYTINDKEDFTDNKISDDSELIHYSTNTQFGYGYSSTLFQLAINM